MPKRKSISQTEDYEERYFINPESVSPHLFCSICQGVFQEPFRAPCGHSFCKECISTWLRTSPTCPEDRKKLVLKEMHHDFILENIIGDQQVACPGRKLGCDFIGKLQTLISHRKTCTFHPSNLPAFLRKEVSEPNFNITINQEGSIESDEDEPGTTMSLKMRLFQSAGEKRQLLCNMFEKPSSPKRTSPEVKRSSPRKRRKRDSR